MICVPSFSVAECFAFLICTKWHNPAIHRRFNTRQAASSSSAGRYSSWNRGLGESSDEDYQQNRVCSLQDIGGHFMKVPLIGFQILLFMRLEVHTPQFVAHSLPGLNPEIDSFDFRGHRPVLGASQFLSCLLLCSFCKDLGFFLLFIDFWRKSLF